MSKVALRSHDHFSCSRCSHDNPLFPSQRVLLFCPDCMQYFKTMALQYGVNYGAENSFYCQALYWKINHAVSATYSPNKHMVVSSEDSLLPIKDLPVYRKEKYVAIRESVFLAEFYIAEWNIDRGFKALLYAMSKEEEPLF